MPRPWLNLKPTIDSSCNGHSGNTISVPPDDMETINNAYRSGVTIWHNHDNIGNFNLANGIVS